MADQVPLPAIEDKGCGVGVRDSGVGVDHSGWYYSRKEIEENSPSRRDGISLREENNFRKTYSRFIVETGRSLSMKSIIIATATVFCHRFFLRRSHAKYDKHRIAIACLFLASKVHRGRESFVGLSGELWQKALTTLFEVVRLSPEEQRQIVIQNEKVLLEAINFDFDVELPCMYLAEVLKKTKNVPKEAVVAALRFINDAFFTSLLLQFNPQQVAGAAFYLAYKFLKLDVPFQSENGWQEFFLATPNELEDISNQILDLYEQRRPPEPVPDHDSGVSGDHGGWYYSRKEIEENSPSRRDGISLREENNFRKTYSGFIVETGESLSMKSIIIATATVFCHRFFLRRSHAKYDKHRIAIACLFLASKVHGSRESFVGLSGEDWQKALTTLFEVVRLSPEEQRQIVIQNEKVLLEAINFDFDVELPYKYLAEVLKKTKNVPKNAVAVALRFINDAFFTSLLLQFKPQQVAGATFYLAYKFLKLDVPFQSENGWQEFFLATPNELEDISNQMLDLYEQRRPPVPAPEPEPEPAPEPEPEPVPKPQPGEPSTTAE